MYRFALGRGGRPVVVWRVRYRNSGIHKPGQVDAGSGTTPTILPEATSRSPTMPTRWMSSSTGRPPSSVTARGASSARCRSSPRLERHGELADRQRSLADRREQLRLPRVHRAGCGRAHGAGLCPRRHRPRRARLPPRLADVQRACAVGGPQALDPDRPDLHLHPQPRQRYALDLGRDLAADRQDGVHRARRHRRARQQQLRRDRARAERRRVRGDDWRGLGAPAAMRRLRRFAAAGAALAVLVIPHALAGARRRR